MTEVKDMLVLIHDQLIADETIAKLTKAVNGNYRIKLYEYPEKADHTQAFIIIEPVGPPRTSNSGSNEDLQLEFTVQISCESPIRTEVKQLQHAIKKVMQQLNYGQLTDGLDVYFADTGHFVDARRFQGSTALYDTNY
ncbi:hypothetical protein ABC418_08955 [Lactiplantibacillus plantarum]|uniref:hypothetical protein n=1 Tax=Lactiplantibacillus plantarum TaxID=1590 RepID=UPI003965C4B7